MPFTEQEFERLGAPHIARSWFAELDLPSGVSRLHNGIGNLTMGGHEWIGVTDPVRGQLVAIQDVEDPRFGQATSLSITLGGANKEFLKSVHATAAQIEGRRADIYFGVFDGETGEAVIGLKKLFPGFMSAPSIHWQGIGSRTVELTIESMWSSQNFPFGGKWNGADQRRRFPGDKGLDFVGVKVKEILN